MELVGFRRVELVEYLTRQLQHFFPDGQEGLREGIDRDLDDALERTGRCVDAAALWPRGRFDPLHSEQNTVFLYFLSNTVHRAGHDRRLATKLFYLNKALNGFSCFYDTELPDIWFVGHSPGIVLARATYGSHLVLYQNSTVGKNHGAAPVLGCGVVMYPNSAIIGDCQVGDGTVLGQGQRLIDASTPGRCYAFSEGSQVVTKPPKRDVLGDLFRG
ncbi:MAG: hypothetical protein AAFU79_21780 [Myxococcota bacterium]